VRVDHNGREVTAYLGAKLRNRIRIATGDSVVVVPDILDPYHARIVWRR